MHENRFRHEAIVRPQNLRSPLLLHLPWVSLFRAFRTLSTPPKEEQALGACLCVLTVLNVPTSRLTSLISQIFKHMTLWATFSFKPPQRVKRVWYPYFF